MVIYVILETLIGIIGGFLIAVCTKKADGVVYGKLDKAGRVTNVLLTVGYALLSPLYTFIGMICEPCGEGVLFIPSILVSGLAASTALFCGLGIGFSVSLRKKGKSKSSFAVQFAGIGAIVLTVLLYVAFVDVLIASVN